VLSAEFGEYHYSRVDLDVKPGQKEKAIAHFSNGKLPHISICRRPPRGYGRHQNFISARLGG